MICNVNYELRYQKEIILNLEYFQVVSAKKFCRSKIVNYSLKKLQN